MTPLAVFQLTLDVNESVIDVMGHVNNIAYIGWMQDAAVAHSDFNGWSWNRYQESGFAFVARSHSIEYISPAYLGDRLMLETWIGGMKRVSCNRIYRFIRETDKKVLATAETRWAFVRIQDGSPARILNEIVESFSVVKRDTEFDT